MTLLKVSEQSDLILITFESTLSEATGYELTKVAMDLINNPQKLFLLDFKLVDKIDQKFYSIVRQFQQFLKKQNKQVASINMNSGQLEQVKSDGMVEVLSPVANVEAAKKKLIPKADPSEFLSKFLGSVVKNTIKVFQIQCNMTVTAEKPQVRSLHDEDLICLAGVIGMTSSVAECNIALCFTEKSFLETYSSMFSEEVTSISEETKDAAAELMNIIYGQTKIELNSNHGMDIEKSVPSVIFGEKLTLRSQNNNKVIVIPFNCKSGRFFIQVSL